MLRPRGMINSVGVSLQLWDDPWPHTVITLWWGRPPRLRVYYWGGKRRGWE